MVKLRFDSTDVSKSLFAFEVTENVDKAIKHLNQF